MTRFFAALLLMMLSSFASLACSLPEGAATPSCPRGQYFDTAATCSCQPEKPAVKAFTPKQLQALASWRGCQNKDECLNTGYLTKNIDCPDFCGEGDIFINAKFKTAFADMVQSSRNKIQCPTAVCFRAPHRGLCIESNCVSENTAQSPK